MRSRVARHFKGHPFEEKYACLTDLQLLVLYRQVFLDEQEEYERIVNSYVKPISQAWSDNFKILFKDFADQISFITDPKLFKKYDEVIRQKHFEKEAKEENLEDLLFETLKQVPSYYEIETEDNSTLKIKEDDSFDEMMTGWVEQKENIFKMLRE